MKERTYKIKCSCGCKFKVTKETAEGVEWDFTGPDHYKFRCKKCGRVHFVNSMYL